MDSISGERLEKCIETLASICTWILPTVRNFEILKVLYSYVCINRYNPDGFLSKLKIYFFHIHLYTISKCHFIHFVDWILRLYILNLYTSLENICYIKLNFTSFPWMSCFCSCTESWAIFFFLVSENYLKHLQ